VALCTGAGTRIRVKEIMGAEKKVQRAQSFTK
jgi:hypothetical protein